VLAQRLKPGDKLGVVAPSSPVTPETEALLQNGISYLGALGLHVVVGRHVHSTALGYCASPEEKAADINEMFADHSISGIICAQGGATSNASLSHLSWSMIQANPKVFMGMSDITVLLNAIYAETALVTFHGADLMWGFGRNPSEYDRDGFVRTLMEGRPAAIAPSGERGTIRGGRGEGVALGGNLGCFLKLAGTPFFPDTDGAILFLEAADISSEACDHMFHQLKHMGVFDKVHGVVVGYVDGLQREADSMQMEAVLRRVSAEYRFPILKVSDFGHNCPNTVVPIGARVRVDADEQTIAQVEPFVA
jgi:muramoyltetrapeptide carboxypeptidase